MINMMMITGVTGQDGLFLAEFLLEKGDDVHGNIRRSSVDSSLLHMPTNRPIKSMSME